MKKTLTHYENLIKEKRSKTPFREFVKDITSWTVLNLYKNKWNICRYPDTWRVKNLDKTEAQNGASYFLDYDLNIWFFENFKNLLDRVPMQFIFDFDGNENAEYVDAAFWVKNGYLTFVAWFWVENIAYSAFCYVNSANIYNSFLITTNCNNIYFSAGINNSFNIFYSKYINDSSNIWFCTNMIGCQECLFCDGLQNQKYCFRNKPLEKEEYLKIKWDILSKKDKFMENYAFILKNPPLSYLSENINGKYNIRCQDVENGYWIANTKNSRNVINTGWENINNFYDCFDVGVNSEDFYGVNGAWDSSKNIYCSSQLGQSLSIYYSYNIWNCSFCFGCIGLKNKSYCILNKQYTKEEWYKKVEEIFAQMDADWILGDFFPESLNPFYFNDTMAYLIDDTFTKEEVEAEGFLWRDRQISVDIPEWLEVIKTGDLKKYQGFDAQGNWRINPEIMKKVIQDDAWNIYRIIKMEYDFLIKHALPLPETHWLDRIRMGFQM